MGLFCPVVIFGEKYILEAGDFHYFAARSEFYKSSNTTDAIEIKLPDIADPNAALILFSGNKLPSSNPVSFLEQYTSALDILDFLQVKSIDKYLSVFLKSEIQIDLDLVCEYFFGTSTDIRLDVSFVSRSCFKSAFASIMICDSKSIVYTSDGIFMSEHIGFKSLVEHAQKTSNIDKHNTAWLSVSDWHPLEKYWHAVCARPSYWSSSYLFEVYIDDNLSHFEKTPPTENDGSLWSTSLGSLTDTPLGVALSKIFKFSCIDFSAIEAQVSDTKSRQGFVEFVNTAIVDKNLSSLGDMKFKSKIEQFFK